MSHKSFQGMYSLLTGEPRLRNGGKGQEERHFLDFLIDGKSLLDTLSANDPHQDFMSCFVAEFPRLGTESRDFLLLKKNAPDLETGRVALYVCPECADLGCGAYTVLVSRQEERLSVGRLCL